MIYTFDYQELYGLSFINKSFDYIKVNKFYQKKMHIIDFN